MPDGALPGWPRALKAPWAAAYVGLSESTFRVAVVPDVPPVRLTDGRMAWLREDLDAWLDRKAGRAPASGENEWMAALRNGQGGSSVPDPNSRTRA